MADSGSRKRNQVSGLGVVIVASLLVIGCADERSSDDRHDLESSANALSSAGAAAQARPPMASQHCVQMASEGTTKDGATVRLGAQEPVCFSDFASAASFATGGRVTLPAGTTPSTMTQQQLDSLLASPAPAAKGAAALASTTVLAVHCRDANQGGGCFFPTWSCACVDGCSAQIPYVGDSWNDVISFTSPKAGCRVRHFRDARFFGDFVTCSTDSGCRTSLSRFNDQTSSIAYIP